jgi:hypothetical protein
MIIVRCLAAIPSELAGIYLAATINGLKFNDISMTMALWTGRYLQ